MKFNSELEEGNYTGRLLTKVSTEQFIISTTQYLKAQCETRLHSHKNKHICMLYEGSDLECRENKVAYERRAGDMHFYGSGELHRTIATTKNSKNINIELRNGIHHKEADLRYSIDNHVNPSLISLKILQELNLNDDFTSVSLEPLCYELVSTSGMNTSIFRPDWVILLREILNDNWRDHFTLAELSLITKIHPITISKNFRKYFLCTYGEYVRKLKIRNSIPLIKNSTMSLTEIAFHCGFSDQSHFTRNFKSYTNFLPKEFRRL